MSDEPFLLLQFKDSNSIYYFFFIIGKNLGILVFTIMTYVLYASGSKIYRKPLQGAVLAPISSAKFLGKVTTSSPEKRTILLMLQMKGVEEHRSLEKNLITHLASEIE